MKRLFILLLIWPGLIKANEVSFRHEVVPILLRKDCSTAECHGSPRGKGGFRLSMNGSDPAWDWLALTRQEFGRRINLEHPEKSLILLKPTTEIAHEGDQRLRRTDPEYQRILQWLAVGAPNDADAAPRCERIEVFPPPGETLRAPEAERQISVKAFFADGSSRDVTGVAALSTSDDLVATLSPEGLVKGVGRGEVSITAQFAGHIRSTAFRVVQPREDFVWKAPPVRNKVDELVFQQLDALQFLPSDPCTDGQFIRRLHLDVLGSLPSVEDTRRFLDDSDPDKREKIIDRLLNDPAWPRYWAQKWGDLLRASKLQLGEKGVRKFSYWLERSFSRNRPYDVFAKELITARGHTWLNPAANFHRAMEDEKMTLEAVGRIFMGADLQCAQCHNHPHDRWTMDEYHGFANFFHGIKRV
ncbi:MAG: DUF1549 domain-containing protein, partial [Verrucomicrobiota bacterium]